MPAMKSVIARFYNSGLVLGYPEGWNSIEILDNRNNTRKQRSDAYTNPLAKNNTWFIYKKLYSQSVRDRNEPWIY